MSHTVIDARILRTTTGRYVERLLHYLQDADGMTQYTVLLLKKDFDDWHPVRQNFKKLEADFDNFKFRDQPKLAKLLRSLQPDLVHFPFQAMPPTYNGKFIMTVHDLTQLNFRNLKGQNPFVFTAKQKLLGLNIKRSLKKSAAIITDTEYVRQELIKQFRGKPDKIHATLLGADSGMSDETAQPKPIKALEDKKFIAYVGTPFAHKNLDRLVEAFMILQKKHPDLHLALAGKHNQVYEEFIQRLADLEVTNVDILGFIDDNELTWLYQNAKAYVFPSLSEGFGLPGLEAMQHGCPVVSSNATCLPEVYGDAAHYFDPLDVHGMAKAIDEVLSLGKLRTRLTTEGYVQVKKFSWQKMAEQTLAIYQQALN